MSLNSGNETIQLTVLWRAVAVVSAIGFLAFPAAAPAADLFQQQPGVQQQQPGAMDQVNPGGDQGGMASPEIGGGNVNVQAEDGGGLAQGAEPANQAYEQPQDLADIPDAEDMTFFDPETIPDSVFPADADWAFNIPVSVSNLPPQVEKLGITCETLYWRDHDEMRNGRWRGDGRENDRIDCGYAKTRIDIENGAYSGNVILGVQMTPGAANNISHRFWLAREYECKMYLIGDMPGDNNSWEIPQTSPISPFWLRADANEPFRWWTGRQPIPDAAKPNPPWADADGGAIGDVLDEALGEMTGDASGDGAGDAQQNTPAAPAGLPPAQIPN